MRGHLPLIAMRRRGVKPDAAFVQIDGVDVSWRDWPQWTSHANLHVEPGEPIASLDLRCLIGLMVFVDGENLDRVRAFEDLARDAGAKVVCVRIGEESIPCT